VAFDTVITARVRRSHPPQQHRSLFSEALKCPHGTREANPLPRPSLLAC
jgi:hypothetical protein